MRGICAPFVLAATMSVAQVAVVAGPVAVPLVADDFDNLLSGSASAIGLPMDTDLSAGILQADVVSQAFTDGAGNFAYLYQLHNTGGAADSVIEAFTCNPFVGASGITTLGYLTDNAPTGFTLGDQLPCAASVDAQAGPTISFVFPAFIAGAAVDPGESSSTLYVLSSLPPGLITGNVIDGDVGSGPIVGPVPEPATLYLIATAAALVARRRRS